MAKIKASKFTSTQKKAMDAWEKKVNNYSGGWYNSDAYKSIDKNSKLYKTMVADETAYNDLIKGGYSGYAAANGLTDYTARLNAMSRNIAASQFQYNAENDAMYRNYKDMYAAQGRTAMFDTIGKSASMTGGYGSSYATTAGNAANQEALNQLSAVQAQLLSLAQEKYQANQSNKQNIWDMTNTQNQQQYAQYQDAIGNAYDTMQHSYNKYNDTYNRKYTIWSGNRDAAMNMFNIYSNNYISGRQYDQTDYWNGQFYEIQKRLL